MREGLEIHGIGFSFLPDFEGKGFGFEVASKLLETSFSELGLKKISAITTKENVAFQKLIIKLVFLYQSIVRLSHKNVDLLYYEIGKLSIIKKNVSCETFF